MKSTQLLREIVRNILSEGGNATATMFDTGDVIQRELPDGTTEPRTAQRIPLKDIGRGELIKILNAMFTSMNNKYSQIHNGEEMWPGGYKPTKHLFSGSSSFLYDDSICTDELCEIKPTLGDIDVMVPGENLQKVWELLNHYQKSGEQIINSVKFVGCIKADAKGAGDKDQLNCTFEYTMKDGTTVDMQVDFERASFTDKIDGQTVPDWFSRMAHSSSFDDMRHGMKGFAHKLLLRSIYISASKVDGTMVTDSSTEDNPKIATRFSKSQGKRVPKTGATMYGFAVTHGLRKMVKDFGTHPEHGKLLKSIPTPAAVKKKNAMIAKKNAKNGTNIPLIPDTVYEKEFDKLLNAAFPGVEATSDNQLKFSSFVGLVELMKQEHSKDTIESTFKSFMTKLIGPRAQVLYANNPELEMKEKAAPLVYFIENLSLSDEMKAEMNEKMEIHKQRVFSGENLDVGI